MTEMKRAVHPLAHDVGEDGARRADQRAGDDERRVAEREADARRRPAGIGVQHRDHDRHVGAADRDDDEAAERQATMHDQPEGEVALRRRQAEDEEDDQHARARC